MIVGLFNNAFFSRVSYVSLNISMAVKHEFGSTAPPQSMFRGTEKNHEKRLVLRSEIRAWGASNTKQLPWKWWNLELRYRSHSALNIFPTHSALHNFCS
jgi:hypothetical protein